MITNFVYSQHFKGLAQRIIRKKKIGRMITNESANELFHFTEKYSSILSIMNDKFKPFFCVEDISFLNDDNRNSTFAFPITCFCDIPIERISFHKGTYGDYGIGLKKEWGMRNNLNIVNYSFDKSLKSASYRILTDYYLNKCTDLNDDFNNNFRNAFSILLMTTKPYEGKKFDKNNRKWNDEIIRFYNEREWRYLPLVDKLNWSLSLDYFSGDYDALFKAIEDEQPKIQEKYTLNFDVADLKYIFLKDRSEKQMFLDDISLSYSDSDLKIIENMIKYKKRSYPQ